jgi:hypothetical protein
MRAQALKGWRNRIVLRIRDQGAQSGTAGLDAVQASVYANFVSTKILLPLQFAAF